MISTTPKTEQDYANKMTKMIINMRACVTRLQVEHVHASRMPGILGFQKPIACVIIERFNRIKSHSPGFNLCHCQSNGLRPLRIDVVIMPHCEGSRIAVAEKQDLIRELRSSTEVPT